eukprot:1346891-Amphidinium_carterae.1
MTIKTKVQARFLGIVAGPEEKKNKPPSSEMEALAEALCLLPKSQCLSLARKNGVSRGTVLLLAALDDEAYTGWAKELFADAFPRLSKAAIDEGVRGFHTTVAYSLIGGRKALRRHSSTTDKLMTSAALIEAYVKACKEAGDEDGSNSIIAPRDNGYWVPAAL